MDDELEYEIAIMKRAAEILREDKEKFGRDWGKRDLSRNRRAIEELKHRKRDLIENGIPGLPELF